MSLLYIYRYISLGNDNQIMLCTARPLFRHELDALASVVHDVIRSVMDSETGSNSMAAHCDTVSVGSTPPKVPPWRSMT